MTEDVNSEHAAYICICRVLYAAATGVDFVKRRSKDFRSGVAPIQVLHPSSLVP